VLLFRVPFSDTIRVIMGSFHGYGINEFVQAAQQELQGYSQQVERFQTLIAENKERVGELQDKLRYAYAQLTWGCLGDITEERFQQVGTQIHSPQLMRLYGEAVARTQRLKERIAEIDATPTFQDREGEKQILDIKLQEVEPLYNIAATEWRKLQTFPTLPGLLERHYGTAQYPHRGIFRFLNAQYLRDWKASDEIVSQMGVKDFAEIISKYSERREQVDVLGRSVTELKEKKADLDKLADERERAMTEINDMPETLQAEAGRILAQYLSGSENAHQQFEKPDEVRQRYLAVDGITHQMTYLDGVNNKIQEDLTELSQRYNRMHEEAMRYNNDPYKYRNKSFSQDQFDKRFGRTSRYDRIYDRYSRTSERIYVYDSYYYDPVGDFLWWDLMTDGRIDGNFIPEVQEYYQTHPDYSYSGGYNTSNPNDQYDSSSAGGFVDAS
jgi:prefoldin subunit 5